MLATKRNFGLSLFDDFFNNQIFSNFFGSPDSMVMKTDVQDKGDSYLLDIELPGFKKEDVKARLNDGYLIISAERSQSNEEKGEDNSYIRRERYYGSTQRSYYVGTEVKQEDIKANFENGVLSLSIPKKPDRPLLQQENYITID